MTTTTGAERRLVTHSGSAHADEVMATALVLALDPAVRRIERKPAPSAAELDDPACYVLDIGRAHTPARLNFDHHQFDPAEPPRCTITLILDHGGLLPLARRFWPWLSRVELFDVRGPDAVAADLNLPQGLAPDILQSPLEEALRSAFSLATTLGPGEPLFSALQLIGRQLVDDLRACESTLAWLEQHIEATEEAGGVKVLWIAERTPAGPEVYYRALDVFRRLHHPDVRIILSPDSRGPGWQLKRLPGWYGADFRRLPASADLKFIHNSGFLAVTREREPRERLVEMIRLACQGA